MAATTPSAGQPLIPQPPATVAALRQAVSQIAPAALPSFTRELDLAADQSRQGAGPAPLQRFAAQWAVYVYIERQPHLSAALREWEENAGTGDADQALRAGSEIGRMLDEAHAAVGVPAR